LKKLNKSNIITLEKNRKYQVAVISILILIAFSFLYRHQIKNKIYYYIFVINSKFGSNTNKKCENCAYLFNDGVAVQQAAYKTEFITPQINDECLEILKKKGVLKNIEPNKYYILRGLTFSKPLLLPKAAKFIDDLSILYYEKCSEKNLTFVPFEITSATRSIESVNDLQKKNQNAIKNSAHLYGKTFDVSYAAFNSNLKQLGLFISALSQLKNQNKCFVKYEANGCLHITAR
jgi:hypothetical protein